MAAWQLLLAAAAALCSCGSCLDNGVATTPPMGWLTWQRFRCNTDCATYPRECIGERLIKETADRLVSDGWLRAGYRYVTVDDCWASKQRDSAGRLQADPQRFPSGMKALADYVHSLGLRFGIYADYGNFTCAGYPGSLGHLDIDAQTFASWGVDLVKLDACFSPILAQPSGFAQFGQAMNKTGRPMVFSCCYPMHQNKSTIDPALLQRTCSMWRMYDDIQDSWSSVSSIISYWGSNDVNMSDWNGPQHWNDPDMLIVGNFGLSRVQQEAQMALWCLWSAPLILSVDLSSIDRRSASILQNPVAISINQDPLGQQGRLLFTRAGVQVWRKLMSGSNFAFVLFFNSDGGTPTRVGVSLGDLRVDAAPPFDVVDVFTGQTVGAFADRTTQLELEVKPSGGVRFLLCRRRIADLL